MFIVTPVTGDAATGLVTSKFEEARSYAGTLWSTAISTLTTIGNMSFEITTPTTSWTPIPLMGLDGVAPAVPERPTISTIEFDWPTFEAEEPSALYIDIPVVSVPSFNVPDPEVAIPDVPSVVWPTFDTSVPVIGEVSIPTKPVVSLPPVPTLSFANIPEPPEYNLPDFNVDAPVADLTPPEPSFVWNEAEYSSDVMDQLKTKIYNDLVSGGSGLGATVEQAIYNRASGRMELEHQQLYDNALNYFSSRGAPLPPGALAGLLIEADHKINLAREDLNNDILIQESKLAQENTHFIITSALQLEKLGMDYSNAIQARAFEAAKYTVEAALQIFGINVEAYKARLIGYQVLAEVYKTRISAEIARAELYKAQIEAVKAHTEIQQAYVQLYMTQLQGIQILYEAYKTEMQGAAIQADIDKTRIGSYATLVEAYSARIKAVTARYEAYQTQVAGELGKVEIYKAQTSAYATQVQALATGAQVDVSRAQIALGQTQAQTDVYKALIQKYVADISAQTAELDGQVKIAGLDIDVFKADAGLYSADLETLAKVYYGRIEEEKAENANAVEQTKLVVNALIARYQLLLEASKGIAQVAGQLGASAFAGVSASAHIGYGESRSDGTQTSASESAITQQSVSQSTIDQTIHSD